MNEAMDCSVKTVVIQPTPRQDEETLWQSGELGYHSPEALTQTLVMIIVKHLKIRSSQAHRFDITHSTRAKSLSLFNLKCMRRQAQVLTLTHLVLT